MEYTHGTFWVWKYQHSFTFFWTRRYKTSWSHHIVQFRRYDLRFYLWYSAFVYHHLPFFICLSLIKSYQYFDFSVNFKQLNIYAQIRLACCACCWRLHLYLSHHFRQASPWLHYKSSFSHNGLHGPMGNIK